MRLDRIPLQMDDMIVGVLYGERISANYKTIATTYPVYCGVEFWEHITGDKIFYYQLAKAFGEVVEEDEIDGSALIMQKVEDIAKEITEKGNLQYAIRIRKQSCRFSWDFQCYNPEMGGKWNLSFTHGKWHQRVLSFYLEELETIPEVKEMLHSHWDEELNTHPLRKYTSVELFAGGGGLALGLSLAGFTHVLLNEFDKSACNTLRMNHPEWNIIEGDVRNIDFTPLRDKVDFLSGGFPCQAFSYAGKQGGVNDTRGHFSLKWREP